MTQTERVSPRVVSYWDGYARWYDLWSDHNNYHERALRILAALVEPIWTVLDIGAGKGVFSLPLCALGCRLTALEPSSGMRRLLHREATRRGVSCLHIDPRRWEDVGATEYQDIDLVVASNSLHLTEAGLHVALKKVFSHGPKNVYLVTEVWTLEMLEECVPHNYELVHSELYTAESSFAYHRMEDVFEHWSYRKGRPPSNEEKEEILASLVSDEGVLWRKATATVRNFWWKQTTVTPSART